jgi:hypothetical protein
MPSQVTYTGKIGAGQALTSTVFTDVRQFAMDFDKRVLSLYFYAAGAQPRNVDLDLSGGTVTLTDTITGNQHTITISVA